MRGQLRIKSRLAPFRRAGISFPTTAEAVPVDIRELDGARLLALASDPALTIQIGQEDGSFAPLKAVQGTFSTYIEAGDFELTAQGDQRGSPPPLSPEMFQRLIDSLVEGSEPIAPPEPGAVGEGQAELNDQIARQSALIQELSGELDRVRTLMSERGHGRIEDLLDSWDRLAGAMAPILELAGDEGRGKGEVTTDFVRGLVAELKALRGSPPAPGAAAEPVPAEEPAPAKGKKPGKAPARS
ncbi:hypothetical protein ACFQ1E_07980 [Sphingomonas canadensis]|uniref:Uncharacterized protein n=1 Tax=Sphingomonas canadensis TaxID=1219257 RepID=A0ABW3H6G9_9SPHN|nr:hypothetical protein [Sphingomonas canadensis]MCW3835975.1 hypothetical protein [Sphingomonas canadensis]